MRNELSIDIDQEVEALRGADKSISAALLKGMITAGTGMAITVLSGGTVAPVIVAVSFGIGALDELRGKISGHLKQKDTDGAVQELRDSLCQMHRALDEQGVTIAQQRQFIIDLRDTIRGNNEALRALQSLVDVEAATQDLLRDAFHRIVGMQNETMKAFNDLRLFFAQGLIDKLNLAADLREAAKRARDEAEFERAYLEAFERKFEQIELLGLSKSPAYFSLELSYVSLALEGEGEGDAQVVLEQNDGLYIEADLGMGKSTLVQREALRICRRSLRREEPPIEHSGMFRKEDASGRQFEARCFPFLLKVRELQDTSMLVEKAWATACLRDDMVETADGIDIGAWVMRLIEQERAILYLDGLDEASDGQQTLIWETFLKLCARYKGKLRFRVTSRPIGEFSEGIRTSNLTDDGTVESEQARGASTIWHRGSIGAWFKPRLSCIAPLSFEQQCQLIEGWYRAYHAEPDGSVGAPLSKEVQERIKGLEVKLDPDVYGPLHQLAGVPFFCAALCVINEGPDRISTRSRHELYSQLVDALIRNRDSVRNIPNNLTNFNLREIHAFVAYQMSDATSIFTSGRSAFRVARLQLARWIVRALRNLGESYTEDQACDLLTDDQGLRRCGLLRSASTDTYEFQHRSLMEFLAGEFAIQLNPAALANRASSEMWRDTILFAAGASNRTISCGNAATKELAACLYEGRADTYAGKRCIALATGCLPHLEGEEKFKTDVIKALIQYLPPQTIDEARQFSAAGDALIESVALENVKGESPTVRHACAEALRCIDSQESYVELLNFVEDSTRAVSLVLLRCPHVPPFHLAELRGLIDTVNDPEGGVTIKSFTMPEFAMPHVSSLSGIDHPNYAGLNRLDLTDCALIRDLAPLASLEQLETLDLTGCARVSELGPLEKLPSLRVLSLADCTGLGSITYLPSLKYLEELDLSRCKGITEFSPLAECKALKKLTLRGCTGFTRLSLLAEKHLPELEWLDLSWCGNVKDWGAMAGLSQLCYLDTTGLGDVGLPPKVQTSPPEPGSGCIDYVETKANVNIPMIWVKGGEFQMGSPEDEEGRRDNETQHPVRLDGYWISATAVTAAQYAALMADGSPDSLEDGAKPVVEVSWHDAKAFCEALGEKYGLPTEAQWEFACRAGATGRYCFGDKVSRLKDYAWFADSSDFELHEVGLKRPNNGGLYDMHGNVWEWCQDWYEEERGVPSNPTEPEGSRYRVLRGGAFRNFAGLCRSAYRGYGTPDYVNNDLGFRVARTP